MRRTFSALLVIPTLACSVVSGLDDFVVGTQAGGTGGTAVTGGAGGTAGGGAVGGAGGGGGGTLPCDEGDLLTDTFQQIQPVTILNTADDDDDPTFTADGLFLIFNSRRSGAGDLYQSKRSRIGDDWGMPALLAELSTSVTESNPVLAPDGLTIWFFRDPPGRIMVARRASLTDPWSAPVEEVLTDVDAGVSAVSRDLLTMMLHSRSFADYTVLAEARRAGSTDAWGPLEVIDELDNGASNQEAWMSPCARHLYWSRAGNLFRATRTELDTPFVVEPEVTEVSVLGAISDPWLSGDQSYLMFAVGGSIRDIYEARR